MSKSHNFDSAPAEIALKATAESTDQIAELVRAVRNAPGRFQIEAIIDPMGELKGFFVTEQNKGKAISPRTPMTVIKWEEMPTDPTRLAMLHDIDGWEERLIDKIKEFIKNITDDSVVAETELHTAILRKLPADDELVSKEERYLKRSKIALAKLSTLHADAIRQRGQARARVYQSMFARETLDIDQETELKEKVRVPFNDLENYLRRLLADFFDPTQPRPPLDHPYR